MTGNDDERERPKKSWRDLDRNRDRSRHVGGDRPESPRNLERSKQSKAALDRAFRDGLIGELVRQREGTEERVASPDDPKRSELIKKIRISEERKQVNEAIDQLLELSEFPDDWDVLIRALDHNKDRVVLRALRHIEGLLDDEEPPRKAVLRQRLIGLDSSIDDDVRELAEALRDRIA